MARSRMTASVARWSATHPWRALLIWVLFVAGAVAAGSSISDQQRRPTRTIDSARRAAPRRSSTMPASPASRRRTSSSPRRRERSTSRLRPRSPTASAPTCRASSGVAKVLRPDRQRRQEGRAAADPARPRQGRRGGRRRAAARHHRSCSRREHEDLDDRPGRRRLDRPGHQRPGRRGPRDRRDPEPADHAGDHADRVRRLDRSRHTRSCWPSPAWWRRSVCTRRSRT